MLIFGSWPNLILRLCNNLLIPENFRYHFNFLKLLLQLIALKLLSDESVTEELLFFILLEPHEVLFLISCFLLVPLFDLLGQFILHTLLLCFFALHKLVSELPHDEGLAPLFSILDTLSMLLLFRQVRR